MNLRDLDYLVAVADTGHFGLAADRCRISQPTLSMQVRKLEAELGATLFERSPRGALTTTIGAEIVARARQVQEQVRQMRDLAARGAEAFVGLFRLGVIPTAGPYLLPRILPVIQRTYPRLETHLREAMTVRLLALLKDNALDAAIVSEPIDDPGLQRAELLRERFMLAAPPEQAALLGPDSATSLAGAPVLMLEEGHCLKDQTVLVCRRLGLQPAPRVQASSVETLRQMVALGYGLAVLPELALRAPFPGSGEGTGAVVAKPLSGADSSRRLVLVWRRTFPRPEQLQALARLIRQQLAADG